MMKSILVRSLQAIALAGLTLSASQVRAQMVNLYVGLDTRQTLPSGTYAGLPNPNAGRLTLLHAHTYPYGQFQSGHYHAIGVYSYTGPAGGPSINDTSAGNAIPEVYTTLPGNTLVPGQGEVWQGRLISRKTRERYSDLRMRSVHSLAAFGAGSAEHFMFNSSGGTRTAPLTVASITLELVSKTEGLGIADTEGNPILANVGDRQVIGSGDDANFEYLPVFWVEDTAEPGDYRRSLPRAGSSSSFACRKRRSWEPLRRSRSPCRSSPTAGNSWPRRMRTVRMNPFRSRPRRTPLTRRRARLTRGHSR
jgi:hypothetical protein